MTENSPFNSLLEEMPRISEAVNSFTSAEVQQRAFEILVGAFGMPATRVSPRVRLVTPPVADPEVPDEDSQPDADGKVGKATRRRARKPVAKKSIRGARDLDFRPEGKESLRDFVARKEPATNHERNLVAVFYVEQVLQLPDITAGDVLLVYKSCGWREPSDLGMELRKTASARKWLNTANSKAISTMAQGRNTVEHDMPIKKAKKTA